MDKKNNTFSTIGTYLLSGALLTGTVYDSANAQGRALDIRKLFDGIYSLFSKQPTIQKKDGTKKLTPIVSRDTNYIYSKGDLTSAGDGVLPKDYSNSLNLSPKSYFSLKDLFSSKNKQTYYFTDAKQSLEKIARNLGPENKMTGEEKAFKQYLINLSIHYYKIERFDRALHS